MVEIRKANMKDLGGIRKLNQELFANENKHFDKTIDVGSSFSDDHRKRFVNNIKNDFVVIAIDKGVIVGYLVGKISKVASFRDIDRLIELDSLLINEKFRSKKIGHHLVAEFKKWAKTNNIKRLRVTASAGNERAIKFYKKEGFEDYNLSLEQEIK